MKNSYRGTTISVFQRGRGKGEGIEYGKTCNLGLFVPNCCHKIFFKSLGRGWIKSAISSLEKIAWLCLIYYELIENIKNHFKMWFLNRNALTVGCSHSSNQRKAWLVNPTPVGGEKWQ